MEDAFARTRRRVLLALGACASAAPACAGDAAPRPFTVVDVSAGSGSPSPPSAHREEVARAPAPPECGRDEMVERVCVPLPGRGDGIGEPCPSALQDVAAGVFTRPPSARFSPEATARAGEAASLCCYEHCSPVEVAAVAELTCSEGRRRVLCAFAPVGGTSQGAEPPFADCPVGILGAAKETPGAERGPPRPTPFSSAKTALRRTRDPGICCYEECALTIIELHEGRPLLVRGEAIVAGISRDYGWLTTAEG